MTTMDDLRVLSTGQLLELADEGERMGFPRRLNYDMLARLDARGKHLLQPHSLFNPDPGDPIIHARVLFKVIDDGDGVHGVLDVERGTWACLPIFEVPA